ncbi:MAG TPA: ABC transporter substrate-binding protein [Candidatus Binatia bacterium]|jgi:NitT/TauT family transport system substrate-binding protein
MIARVLAALAAVLLLQMAPARADAQPLKKLNLSYTATSPYQAVVIIAQQAGLFKKYGLDVTLIFMAGGSLGISAMMSGEVPITQADGSASVGASAAGVDVVIFGSFLNTFPYSLVSLPEIKTVEQLKGTKIAISRFGSATDLSVKMALAKVGLNPDSVTLLQVGAQTARAAALQSKNVQATIITPPFTLTARKLGYNTLIDMAQLNIPYQLTALVGSRAYLKTHRDIILSLMRASSDAIHFYKTQKEASIKILSKYLQTTDREALEETYREVSLKAVPDKPYPTLAGVQTILDELSAKNPKLKSAKPDDFVDMSFVKELDDEKFFDRLYKR